MISLLQLDAINNYLIDYGVAQPGTVSYTYRHFETVIARNYIIKLLEGKVTKTEMDETAKYFGLTDKIASRGSAAKSSNDMNDIEFLLSVLDNCCDDTINELLSVCEDNARLARLIASRRKKPKLDNNMSEVHNSVETMLSESKHMHNPFYTLLCNHLDRKGYKTDAEFYNSILMSRQCFSRLRSGTSMPSKKTVLLLIVGLRLNYAEALEFLHTAGYTFKRSDKRDAIISFIIQNYNYNLDMVNDILYRFGVSTLYDLP